MHMGGVVEPEEEDRDPDRNANSPPARDHQAEHEHSHEEEIRHDLTPIGSDRSGSEAHPQGSFRNTGPGEVAATGDTRDGGREAAGLYQ